MFAQQVVHLQLKPDLQLLNYLLEEKYSYLLICYITTNLLKNC
jgi:hypothetical protein